MQLHPKHEVHFIVVLFVYSVFVRPSTSPSTLSSQAWLHIRTDKVTELNNLKNVIVHIKWCLMDEIAPLCGARAARSRGDSNIQSSRGWWWDGFRNVLLRKKRKKVWKFGLNLSLLCPNLPAVIWTLAQSPAVSEHTSTAAEQQTFFIRCARLISMNMMQVWHAESILDYTSPKEAWTGFKC